jgi:hypothetical protein
MREQKPVYDQRLLPVLYSSIGILRRLGNHLMSSVDRPRDEYLAFYFWCKESNISGHDQGDSFYSGQPLLATYTVLSFTILRHFFRYAYAARHVR